MPIGLGDFARGAVEGAATGVLGAPVDLAALLLSFGGYRHPAPVGGSQWWRDRVQDAGVYGPRTGSVAESAGEIIGSLAAPGPDAVPLSHVLGGLGLGVKAYHATFDDFDRFDFRKVGRFTRSNATDTDPNSWGMRLARLGAWFGEQNVGPQMAAPIVKQAELEGTIKDFRSLDELADHIAEAGGAMRARSALRREGFDLVRVGDEEFGGTSYVALHPRAIRGLSTVTEEP